MNSTKNFSCDGVPEVCIIKKWFLVTINLVNAVGIIFNLFHLHMLKRIAGAELSTYLKIMMIYTGVEVLYAICNIGEADCFLRQYLMKSKVASIIALLFGDSINFYRFVMLTVAFIDRW